MSMNSPAMNRSCGRKYLFTLWACLCLAPAAYAVSDTLNTAARHEKNVTLGDDDARHFSALRLPDTYTRHDRIVAGETSVADSILDKRARAHALLTQVVEGQRFLETLDAFSTVSLPVGIAKAGGLADYTILVDRIRFTKEGALMDVYVSLALPQTGTRIAFHGQVPLSANGGIAGNARVFLLGDHAIAIDDKTLVTLKGSPRSYVEFDCSGFLGVNLDGELEFSSDLIVPESESGEALNERLRVAFTTYAASLHDILVDITVPPFQVKGLDGFGFHVTKAYLDWSDLANPPQIAFPEQYSSPLFTAGLDDLWQGIYLSELEVRLPAGFAGKEGSDRIALGAGGMIIDNQGVTGELYAAQLLSDGDMSGWHYTIDKLSLELVANHVAGFGLEGLLSIPVVSAPDGKQAAFEYRAHRSADGQYVFSVAMQDELKLDLWAADLKLLHGSSVVVRVKENRFLPAAHLNGELSINLSNKSPGPRFNSIRFENMIINSEAPYFRPGTFGLGREGENASLAKYPVVVNDISIKSEDRRAGIAFDVTVNISGKPEEGSFAGKGTLVVWGAQDGTPRTDSTGTVIGLDRYSWRFDKVELTSLKIAIKIPKVIELSGAVRFFDDDETYGEGFKGSLKGSIHAIKLEAEALFGKTDTFRYWYADALVELRTGVPMIPGVLSAFGFGGGYYSKMKQGVSSGSVTLGRPPSGITYVPDEHSTGVRAIVLIGTPRPEAMRGDVSLEVSINRHGGINSVTLAGNANFMSAASPAKDHIRQLAAAAARGDLAKKLGALARGQVYGSVRLHFDNANDLFHGNLEVYVNVAGGIVRGVSEGNKAGWAVLHFEKNDWYIHIGTPDQPLGLEVARIFKSKSYFMLGKHLPASPPPPAQVTEILGDVDLDYMRDMNALESGMGIAFGLHFIVDTGDLRFLMFYGRFSAGTGLDFMLKDYGNEYHCAGSPGPLGINGWYANGQAYAFVMGKIGIKVNLRFYKGSYDILSIGAAAVLQAKGPNPFWMKGTVGGYYKILGGLIKGKCRFEVTVGKECKPVAEQNLLEEINMIAGISPQEKATGVDVFSTPQVAFNIPVGEIFEITDMEEQKHFFRAVLDEFVLLENGRPIEGELEWNAESDVVVFNAADILPEREHLTARATLRFEERKNGNWTSVRVDGKVIQETARTTFQTGEAPDVIPASNVLVSYPLSAQLNFYPGEYREGFIQLRDGQPYLFAPKQGWRQVARWTDASSGLVLESKCLYENTTRRIRFDIPSGLANASTYRLELMKIPAVILAADHNVSAVETQLALDASAGGATLTTQSIEGTRQDLEETVCYSVNFRTSRYDTFREKMQRTTVLPAVRTMHGTQAYRLKAYLRGDESLGQGEITDAADYEKLIALEAILDGNRWYERYAYPVVYEGYPLAGKIRVARATAVPPIEDVHIGSLASPTPPDAGPGQLQALPLAGHFISYRLGETVVADFRELQRQAVNYIIDYPALRTRRLEALINSPIPYLREGVYKVKLTYRIPGININTSSYELSVINPVPDND